MEKEGAGDSNDDNSDNDKDESDLAEFAEDAPDENNGDERYEPDDECIDAKIVTDAIDCVVGAVHDLLAGFGDLVHVDFGSIFEDIVHILLADYDYWYYYSIRIVGGKRLDGWEETMERLGD